MLTTQDVNQLDLITILCLLYLFHSLYYREFLSPSRTNPIAVSQCPLHNSIFVVT